MSDDETKRNDAALDGIVSFALNPPSTHLRAKDRYNVLNKHLHVLFDDNRAQRILAMWKKDDAEDTTTLSKNVLRWFIRIRNGAPISTTFETTTSFFGFYYFPHAHPMRFHSPFGAVAR
ncbi:Protein of unknown function [Pyronema omphalodes CBS 100304]|uniref:Uncharacterized protein n=1 Tax=Pyronema omphalodes (strain CBS 100304) TaxID=1076935 RepID=U4L9N8_PYROM|nr:Protein of unknown function [Pyronema omphalodes CBS 100304]